MNVYVAIGLMISGFAQAYAVTKKKEYKVAAIKAASFVKHSLFDVQKGILLRNAYRNDVG